MALPGHTPVSVGVFGGDPVVGRALEQLLRSAGYTARFLTEASFEGVEPPDGIQLLLLMNEADAERRAGSMALLKGTRATANIPILELVSSLERSLDGVDGFILWPCRVDELQRRIEAVLLQKPHPDGSEASDG